MIEINPYRYCPCSSCHKLTNQNHCKDCGNISLDKLYSATDYNNKLVKKLINEIRHHFQIKELCLPLSALILMHLDLVGFEFKDDMIMIPVPSNESEKKLRGFNEAEEIVKIISEKLHIPYSLDSLTKTKGQNNELGCFKYSSNEKIKGKTILLIDDLYITGIKMEECAKVLKNNGAKNVYGITASRG
jgi:predicted amidophosphoribosyltransferase